MSPDLGLDQDQQRKINYKTNPKADGTAKNDKVNFKNDCLVQNDSSVRPLKALAVLLFKSLSRSRWLDEIYNLYHIDFWTFQC